MLGSNFLFPQMFAKEEIGLKQSKAKQTKIKSVLVSHKEKLDWKMEIRAGPEDVLARGRRRAASTACCWGVRGLPRLREQRGLGSGWVACPQHTREPVPTLAAGLLPGQSGGQVLRKRVGEAERGSWSSLKWAWPRSPTCLPVYTWLVAGAREASSGYQEQAQLLLVCTSSSA